MNIPFSEQITNEMHKQHLNLSNYAWNIIENDILDFSSNKNSPVKLATFLNRIIINCHDNFPSISIFPVNLEAAIEKQKEQYKNLLAFESKSSSRYKLSPTQEQYLLEQYQQNELLPKLQQYSKDTGKKFRLNNKAFHILCDIPEDCPKITLLKTPGKYLKALFEEYARLPYFKREHIYFYSHIEEIEKALRNSCSLKVTTGGNTYEVIPYKLETDSRSTFSYLIGKSKLCSHSQLTSDTVASFRLSRIQEIRCIYTHIITNDQKLSLKKEVEKAILERGVPFLLDNTLEVRIRFTDKGLQKYTSQIYLRPAYKECINSNEYIFEATALQIKAYFFKFGKDAEILAPQELRQEFISKYQQALNNYKSED